LIASSAALSLGACKGEAGKEAAASQAPDAKPGIEVTGARLVLPGVAGNPGAAYFSVENKNKVEVVLASVSVTGAGRAEIHGMQGDQMVKADAVSVGPMGRLDLVPGKEHAMVYDIGPDLKPGGETEITLTFADGDKVSVKAKVESTGEAAMGGMAGMASEESH
jgi:copper(I)-binding protein